MRKPEAKQETASQGDVYRVEMDTLPGKAGALGSHRIVDNLTEAGAKTLVNETASIVWMKRIVIFKTLVIVERVSIVNLASGKEY